VTPRARRRRIGWRGLLIGSACVAMIAAAFASAAAGAGQPTAHTGEPGQLTVSSATLKGSVYPGGMAVSYRFEYGLTTAYGAQTATTPVPAGTQTIHVEVPVTGLAAGTTYHERLVVLSPAGTIDGSDRTFVTKKVPLTFPTLRIPHRVPFERPFSVTGTLSGTESANRPVVLQVNPFPFLGGFRNAGSAHVTGPDGSFAFRVAGLSENTQLRVSTVGPQPVVSHVTAALVMVRVTLHVRSTGRPGFARVFGTVTPAQPGAAVELQLLRRGRKPMGVGSTPVLRGGVITASFGRVLRIHKAGLYRAYVHVSSGKQVSSASPPVLIR
jgi:hypothetical protein